MPRMMVMTAMVGIIARNGGTSRIFETDGVVAINAS
jgi:hypothetical protein